VLKSYKKKKPREMLGDEKSERCLEMYDIWSIALVSIVWEYCNLLCKQPLTVTV